jgi:hypothetical protein
MKEWLDKIKSLNGAIALSESIGIDQVILSGFKSVEKGIAIDLGSHAGRSSISAIKALSRFHNVINEMCLVDLLYDLDNPDWSITVQQDKNNIPWGYAKETTFKDTVKQNVELFSRIPVTLYGLSSRQFLEKKKERINYIFIDSDDHQMSLVLEECKTIENRVNRGGLVLFHDFKNQYVGPAIGYDFLLSTKKYEKVDMDWVYPEQILKYYDYLDLNNWHMPGVLFPRFVGCLRRV